MTNCQSYSETGICRGCISGYVFQAGRCERVDCPNFQDIDTGLCSQCPTGLVYRSGLCYGTLQANCKFQNNQNQCDGCFPGFYLNSMRVCQTARPKCLRHDPVTGRCLECQRKPESFVENNDQCVPEIENCQLYSPNTNQNFSQCVECRRRYQIIN